MQTVRKLLLAGLAALSLGGLAAAPAPALTSDEAAALGRQAYLYGLPLLEFLRVRETYSSVRCPDDHANAPVNALSNASRFADASDRAIVAPNVDVLVTMAQLDLGEGPVVLSHPDMGKRFFVFQFLDPATNTFAYVGTRTTGSKAGRFALTWAGAPGHVAGAKAIASPSRRVWMIGRTLAGDRADQRVARGLMRRYALTPPGGALRFPAGCRPGPTTKATTPAGLAFLDALGDALRDNPPPAADGPQLAQLAPAGIGPGLHPQDAGLEPEVLAGLAKGVDDIAASLPGLVRQTLITQAEANHGWTEPGADLGNYGTDYTFRAGVALAGLGANTREEATYPTAYTDASGARLDGAKRYRLTFTKAGLPPARAFWSLTMYDQDGYLVANPQHRYAIGDSHPGLVRRADGSVVVVLARTKPSEPGVNWLPTPPGPFRLNLRLYWPKAPALSGAWQPPPVQPVG